MPFHSVAGAGPWAALLVLLLLAGSVEIYAPLRATVGEEVEVVVLVNGVKAPGSVKVVSPAGEEKDYGGGYAKFGADGAGEWRVEYAGIERRVLVERTAAQMALEPLMYGATVIALFIIARAYLKSRRKLFVRKWIEGNGVGIEIRNGREELADVRVIDNVPEDAELDLPSGAKEWKTIDGRSVRWSIPVLQAGRCMILTYGIKTGAKVLPAVEVRASDAREIRARSDEVRVNP